MKHFKTHIKDHILILTFSMAGKSVNIFNEASLTEFKTILEKNLVDDAIHGIVITSDKPHFITGVDLDFIHQLVDEKKI